MDMDRRGFVAGILASGCFAALSNLGWTKDLNVAGPLAPNPQTTTLALLLRIPGSASLLRGVEAASGLRQARLAILDASTTGDRAALPATRFGAPCLALLPEAEAILLLEALRSAGKPLLWMGMHAYGVAPDGMQRHEFSVSESLLSPGLELRRQLEQLRLPYILHEGHLAETASSGADDEAATRPYLPSGSAADSLEALGYALGLAAFAPGEQGTGETVVGFSSRLGVANEGLHEPPPRRFASLAMLL